MAFANSWYRDLSHPPLHRLGLYNPSHELMVPLCCMYGAYHVLIKYVNSQHDIYIGNCEQLLIGPRHKAWSVFAEAYDADAREFGITTPKFSLSTIINWHLSYEGPKCIEMQSSSSSQSSNGLDLTQDPLVLLPVPPGLDSVAHNLVGSTIPGVDDEQQQ